MMEYNKKDNEYQKQREAVGPVKTQDVINTFNQKVALWLTNTIGSMKMFWFMLFTMTTWMAGLGEILFNDPYPFSLMLLVFAGVFQALAMVAIMVGQNILSKAADVRSEMTYIDTEAILHEVKELHEHLHHQDQILTKLEQQHDLRKSV